VAPDVSKNRDAFFFKEEQESLLLRLFTAEGRDITILRNVGNHSPKATMSHCRRAESQPRRSVKLKSHRGKVRHSNAITGLDRPLGFQEAEAHRFIDNRHV
jgi:hypothetical protein